MRRLVYSPKAQVFVKTDSGVRDLSEYITAGSITRRVSQVSSAQVTIRNPRFRWTRPGNPTFHPMDPVTIYLTRLRNRPVQVFTGYLDATPYLQLFPGTVTITASCTLKRIIHTYWDPALPFVNEFLAQYGWQTDRAQGFIFNQPAEIKRANNNGTTKLTDGSFGKLLYAILEQVGHWDPNTIYIENLPSNLVDKIDNIYNQFAKENELAQEEFKGLLRNMIGDGSYGNGGGSEFSHSGSVKGADKIVPAMEKIANKWGVPPALVIAVAHHESGLGQSMHSPGNPHYGWYQWQDGQPYIGSAGLQANPSRSDAYDLGYATNLFAKALSIVAERHPGITKDWTNWAEITQGAQQGAQFHGVKFQNDIKQAKSELSRFGGKPDLSRKGDNLVNARNKAGVFRRGDLTGNRFPGDTQSQNKSKSEKIQPKSKSHWENWILANGISGGPNQQKDLKDSHMDGRTIGALIYLAKRGWSLSISSVYTGHSYLTASGNVSEHSKHQAIDITTITKDGKSQSLGTPQGQDTPLAKEFKREINGLPPQLKVHQAICYAGGLGWMALSDHGNHFHLGWGPGHVDKIPSFTVDGSEIAGGGLGDPGDAIDAKDESLAQAKAAAFATFLDFPGLTEQAEAIALQGQKSLMNDKSLFPFVEQLSGASLRSFQSMPNGNFYAFFPDYFGGFGHRSYYWVIDDIEILDGEIQLSDDALATHVYVVGDTIPQGGITLPEKLASGGVVNVFNAFQTGFVKGTFLESSDEEAKKGGKVRHQNPHLSNKADAVKFLQRYGARPLYEEAPMIRSPYYEAFLAYQRFLLLWSRQFLTTFTFTFMPELFPGGIVAFEDHGIQCYIDEVVHTFDYESGFATQANLSAPASTDINNPNISRGMVRSFAL